MMLIFIDCEYCYTEAIRKSKLPNYKAILNTVKSKDDKCVIYAYFVGPKDKKRNVVHFLFKSGVDYVNVLDLGVASKPQIIGVCMALDIVRHAGCTKFSFVAGDDYLVPIVDAINTMHGVSNVYHYPDMVSPLLPNRCALHRLSEIHFLS